MKTYLTVVVTTVLATTLGLGFAGCLEIDPVAATPTLPERVEEVLEEVAIDPCGMDYADMSDEQLIVCAGEKYKEFLYVLVEENVPGWRSAIINSLKEYDAMMEMREIVGSDEDLSV